MGIVTGHVFYQWDLNLNKVFFSVAGWVSGLNNVSRKIFGSKAGMAVVGRRLLER